MDGLGGCVAARDVVGNRIGLCVDSMLGFSGQVCPCEARCGVFVVWWLSEVG